MQKDMEDVLPDNIIEEYGTIVSTTLNGNYLSLPTEYEHQIVTSFKRQGYVVERSDDLSFS